MPAPSNRLSNSQLKKVWSLIFEFFSADTVKLIIDSIDLLRSLIHERSDGLYEVLDFDHTLELCDANGQTAIYHKRETVRLLQDHVAAYLDQAWGQGEIFADYQCSPGKPVDRYRCGYRYCTLISLRQVHRRGDVLRLAIDRTVHNGFNVNVGWSETTVRHKTHRFCIAVIFPSDRLPKRTDLHQVNSNRTTPLSSANTEVLPDGRWRVFWETKKPKLFETYTLKWAW